MKKLTAKGKRTRMSKGEGQKVCGPPPGAARDLSAWNRELSGLRFGHRGHYLGEFCKSARLALSARWTPSIVRSQRRPNFRRLWHRSQAPDQPQRMQKQLSKYFSTHRMKIINEHPKITSVINFKILPSVTPNSTSWGRWIWRSKRRTRVG